MRYTVIYRFFFASILAFTVGCSKPSKTRPISKAEKAKPALADQQKSQQTETELAGQKGAPAPAPTPTPTPTPAPTPTPTAANSSVDKNAVALAAKVESNNKSILKKKGVKISEIDIGEGIANNPENEESGANNSPIDKDKAAAKVKKQLDDLAIDAENKKPTNTNEDQIKLWEDLISYISEHGKEVASPMGFYFSLEDLSSNNRFEPFTTHAISVVGGRDAKGGIAFTRVEAVWNSYKPDKDGNMDGDQYMFLLSKTGNIARTYHYHFIKDKQDHVLVHESVETTSEDAEKKWNEIREYFFNKVRKK
jgi:hypothetical protein